MILILTLVDATLWHHDNIREMRLLRECFHRDHAEQIAYLFPGSSMERDRREARALDHIGRLLKSGTDFCSAYNAMIQYAELDIVNSLNRNDDLKWLNTLEIFKLRKAETENGCQRAEELMSAEEKQKYRGILSEFNQCINRVQLSASKALISSQYKAEEQGF